MKLGTPWWSWIAPVALAAGVALWPRPAAAQAITPNATPLPAPAVAPPPAPENQSTPSSRKARQVVEAAITALGGQKYLDNRDRSGKGMQYSFSSSGNLAGVTRFWSFERFPAQERIELTKKRNIVYIFSGGKGWQITYKGVVPMTHAELTEYQQSADHSIDMILKRWASNPQTLILDQGLSQVNVTQVESISFLTPSGRNAVVDFSILSHLPLRVSWRQNDPLTGGHYQESVIYGNWVRQKGIETPYVIDRFRGSLRQSEVNYTDVSFKPFPDTLFTPKPLKK